MLALIVAEALSRRESLQAMSVALGAMETITAEECACASTLAMVRRPDLVVVDGGLPEAEVLQLAKSVARTTPRARLVVFAATGSLREVLKLTGVALVTCEGEPPGQVFDKLAHLLRFDTLALPNSA